MRKRSEHKSSINFRNLQYAVYNLRAKDPLNNKPISVIKNMVKIKSISVSKKDIGDSIFSHITSQNNNQPNSMSNYKREFFKKRGIYGKPLNAHGITPLSFLCGHKPYHLQLIDHMDDPDNHLRVKYLRDKNYKKVWMMYAPTPEAMLVRKKCFETVFKGR